MISIFDKNFDPEHYLSTFRQQNLGSGAICNFVGMVRRDDGCDDGCDDDLISLKLEHHPRLTQKSIEDIASAAQLRLRLDDILIIHRIGEMAYGEPIVLVAIASKHRRDAFAAADFIMDGLKTRALFWKKEIRRSGDIWIEPRVQDYADAARWK
ncbi:hypothetical protein LPB140_00530 [Sphingorhabdus lutea]|uniref:Molybdopterin synthase catalytic subunit n=1 Tax=Sphingorhabdus lutea TaxID=1913578 RepID=A0A1L3J8Y7_9SPHN|nr:molybdenum cofactor biosynthesis protein MoaE [Sphingorhabdus lutea]APG61578.1 hypothetical protein LPB140_00530 [Sphingorhabdus lutea]